MFSCDKERKPSFDEKPSSSFSGKKIKTHTLYYYEIENRFGENVNILSSKDIFKYDSNDNLIESSNYDSDGNLKSKTISK